MNIITISREFGSGGRELGKRLADLLGYAYYDREIEEGIAQRTQMDLDYITRSVDRGLLARVPLHFGRTLSSGNYALKQQIEILEAQQKMLKEMAASSHCVIVGRAADVILSEQNPLKIFVYADMAYKISRCQGYAEPEAPSSARELEKSIRKIDSRRSQYHRMFSDIPWGDKSQYHLCVNTTGLSIEKVTSLLAPYAQYWFQA